jgi:hypothetical protein
MRKEAPQAIDAQCLDALMAYHAHLPSSGAGLLGLSDNVGTSGVPISQEAKYESIVPVL